MTFNHYNKQTFKAFTYAIILAIFIGIFGMKPALSEVLKVDDVFHRINESGRVKIAISPIGPPYAFLKENGAWSGFDVEVANELSRRMGTFIDIIVPEWDELIGVNWNGRWDFAVFSAMRKGALADSVDFSIPYYYQKWAFIKPIYAENIKGLQDLSGMTVGFKRQSVAQHYLQGNINALPPAPLYFSAPDMRLQGFIRDELALEYLIGHHDDSPDIVLTTLKIFAEARRQNFPISILDEPILALPYHIVMEKGNDILLREINLHLENMHEEGVLRALTNKWFGIDLSSASIYQGQIQETTE